MFPPYLSVDNKIKSRRKLDVMGPDRETIIAMTDDPVVIHRGEILPFENLNNKYYLN